MNKIENSKWKILPNILTIFRIVLTPFIIVLLFIDSKTLYSFSWINSNTFVSITFLISGILFLIACFSDFLDGYLARKNNWISDFGKIWDPIADKVLTTSIYICFSLKNFIPFYFVLIMITRDIVVDAYRQTATKKGIVTPANIWGKLKTIIQMLSIIAIYFIFNDSSALNFKATKIEYYFIQNILVMFATISSCFSWYVYVKQINKELKRVNYDKQ